MNDARLAKIPMRAVYLAVIVLLVSGGLYLWIATFTLQAGTHPVPPFAASSSGSAWWVGASSTDSSALPNTGVRGTIQVISTAVVGCLAFWVADDSSNGIWGQVGYYICNSSTPVAFYQIWNLGSDSELTSGSTSVSVGAHTFSMYLQSGTTWAYSLDGTVFGTYNMGANSSSSTYPVYALSEEEANSTFAFPAVTYSTALQVLKSDTWDPVQTAESYGTSWGVAGAAQSTGLQANQIAVGGSLAALPQGTQLWSTGATSTTSSSSTISSTSTSIDSTATVSSVTSMSKSTTTPTTTSTVTSATTSTVTSTAKTTSSMGNSPTTATSTVKTTQTSTGTATSATEKTTTSTTTSPTTTTSTVKTTQTGTTTSIATSISPTPTSTQTSSSVETSTSAVVLPQPMTTASQVMTTTDTQTVTSILTLNQTSTVTAPLTVTSTTVSTSIQSTTVTETISSRMTTTATETVPSATTVTVTLPGTPIASTTCDIGTSSPSSPCASTEGTSGAFSLIEGGFILAILAFSLTGLALVVNRRIRS